MNQNQFSSLNEFSVYFTPSTFVLYSCRPTKESKSGLQTKKPFKEI